MKKVIAVFDMGKTNKKLFLFDKDFNVVYKNSVRFEECVDDDNDPCDDIEAIENWIQGEIKAIQEQKEFNIKAINFSTHGATLVYLDKDGKRITPLYNYLKPLDLDFTPFYEANGGIEEFSRKTASPAYGMLNSGLQMYWLKQEKPHYWKQVETILHYPQYLSYIFSNKITADFTSLGAHTAIWDFDAMQYHDWLAKEGITLPEPKPGKNAALATVNGQEIAIGKGLHDSSSSIIPLLEEHENSNNEFILLSTGTWIICMNPFSKETLTTDQLKNDCLCFMTPDKKQIKSSMQFLGRVHEVNAIALSEHFGVEKNHYLELKLNKPLCSEILGNNEHLFFPNDIAEDFVGDLSQVKKFDNYESAYYQLIFEISKRVHEGINRILDKENNLKDVYISGGFNKNDIFVEYLNQLMPEQKIQFPKGENASALGAALLMKDYLKS
ncbi:FGGY family carbohydrate kinase [Winogradskyella psychrotolerans]|uniref:FGGY family carbohydrate kinase n=1 Tax=Winogradskyella psychrotolerans TaxID=1344585 RepID=UPI001C0707FA|nr:FGGY family carbohydrate kinase [Winogradskyella psychrotolerans]MBU2929903.1 carbohydrate kinase [Winogradskyella psychrotolerans]